jgi:trans-2,3-dihydro-3-hydroxyanthranilate isomerase
MRVDIAWWELDGSDQTIDSLREHLGDGAVDEWAQVAGLRLKLWMADRARNRWGAVMLWESEWPADRPLPRNRAADMIGRPADHRTCFEVEVAVEGMHPLGDLGACDVAHHKRREA